MTPLVKTLARSCRRFRRGLELGNEGDHAASCEPCHAYQRDYRAVTDALTRPTSEHWPGVDFVGRVTEALPSEPAGPIAWAAWRVLPVTVALLAVLAVAVWTSPVATEQKRTALEYDPTEALLDLVAWDQSR